MSTAHGEGSPPHPTPRAPGFTRCRVNSQPLEPHCRVFALGFGVPVMQAGHGAPPGIAEVPASVGPLGAPHITPHNSLHVSIDLSPPNHSIITGQGLQDLVFINLPLLSCFIRNRLCMLGGELSSWPAFHVHERKRAFPHPEIPMFEVVEWSGVS